MDSITIERLLVLTWVEKRFSSRFGDCAHSDLFLMEGAEEKGVVQRSRPGVWIAAVPYSGLSGNRVYRKVGTAHTKAEAKKVLRQQVTNN